MKVGFLLLFCLLGFQSLSQEKMRLWIQCISVESKDSVFGARIELQQGSFIQTIETDKKGMALFPVDINGETIKLKITHGFYDSRSETINPGSLTIRENQSYHIVYLSKGKTQQLGAVTAYAPGVPQVAYQSKTHSVADFEFLPNGELLLLLYPKTLKKGSELGVLSNNEIVSRFELPEKPIELIRDFRGNPHVVCEKGVYGIFRTAEEVGISNIEKSYFMRYVMPIIDTSLSKLYFSNFNKNYPAFDYKIYDRLDSTYKEIISIQDDVMMEMYRSEYKWVDVRTKLWAMQQELDTGIDKEIWVGSHYFTQSIYYKELYAPMFNVHDTIVVFDYYRDKMLRFDRLGQALDSTPVFHHYQPRQNGWKRKLVQDDVTKKIYAFYQKEGVCSLREVNINTGELGTAIEFRDPYIDTIAVHDQTAFYIYRPFESAQKKFLFQSRLPGR